ncbi:MAG TPA: NAD(P)/FAD-dependent oxidoreductase [Aeromonadales bacterium]|nr:NAD(P)/FAD-dependent oxidoreductase [Aeromonadales bacterium]
MKTEHIDIFIIGAGLSGIGVAYYLQKNCPQKSLAIFEGRDAIGGTWDLFRYPGIRSDSDMFTYGYQFKPWTDRDSLASGDKILNYLTETIEENNLTDKIRLSHRVKKMNWNSDTALWELTVEVNGQIKNFTSNFAICCSGYYDYQQGYQPAYKNQQEFKGEFVHPQNWPESLDYNNKKVVVIGSGATAVTLVPSMAKQAKRVTMLQRSPTYIASIPMQDWFLKLMFFLLPEKWASRIVRKRNIIRGNFYYYYMTKNPEKAKKKIAKEQDKLLSPSIDRKHFKPSYNPWDQRFCLIPDGDLFDALNEGKADIKTDIIDKFVDNGILLKSGETLEADIIVSATGLNVKILSGIDLTLDGEKVSFGDKMFYRGVLLEDIPNLGFVFGYTNASWTLKVELVSQYIARVINFMDENNMSVCVPKDISQVKRELFLNLTSGYIQRAQEQIPKQGAEQPWRLEQNYNKDKAQLKGVEIDDGVLQFF